MWTFLLWIKGLIGFLQELYVVIIIFCGPKTSLENTTKPAFLKLKNEVPVMHKMFLYS